MKKLLLMFLITSILTGCQETNTISEETIEKALVDTKENDKSLAENKKPKEDKSLVQDDIIKEKTLNLESFKINGDELSFPLVVGDLKNLGYTPTYSGKGYAFTEIYTTQQTKLDFNKDDGRFVTGTIYANQKDGPDKAKIRDLTINKNYKANLDIELISYDMTKEKLLDELKDYTNIEDVIDINNYVKIILKNTILEIKFTDNKVEEITFIDKNLEYGEY